jgi:hypothetical protein
VAKNDNFMSRTFFFRLLLWLGLAWLLWAVYMQRGPQSSAESSINGLLCQTPIAWRLATLDPAFRLSEAQALALITEAAEQWNRIAGQQLFVYDAANGFPIHFQHDERQQQLAQRLLLQRNVQRYDEHLEVLQRQYQRQLALVQQQDSRVQQLQQKYQQLLLTLEQQGGRTQPAALQQQWRILEEEQRVLIQQADALNAEQQRLQQMVTQRNNLLPEQQAVGSHELGVMSIRQAQRQMVIYAFADHQDLLVTLQHEFGHALGLPHSDESAAVMHAQLHSGQQWLTVTDFRLWQLHCLGRG